jgi:PhnB protein
MVTPYLNFAGQAAEAIDFYEKVFNGQDKRVMRYGEAPPNPEFPIGEEQKNLVLHGEMTISGTKINFSDTQESVDEGSMISLAADFKTKEEVRRVFDKLKEGGEVLMELAPQFFSPLYGWVLDRFGVSWQVMRLK